jgi:hypothetical protein
MISWTPIYILTCHSLISLVDVIGACWQIATCLNLNVDVNVFFQVL